jgi:hypothetical protein
MEALSANKSSLMTIEQKGMTFDLDLLFILLFYFPLFLGGKRKEEENNQSREQKSFLYARSLMTVLRILPIYIIKQPAL